MLVFRLQAAVGFQVVHPFLDDIEHNFRQHSAPDGVLCGLLRACLRLLPAYHGGPI
jgi:hypothetical protein